LSKITEAIERRVKELSSLHELGGLRRSKIKLGIESQSKQFGNKLLHSSTSMFVYADWKQTNKISVEGSVRWRPGSWKDMPLEPLERFNKAVKLCFGIDSFSPSDLYQMVPFSWLADYFVDLSSFLNANRAALEFNPYDITIMRKGVFEQRLSNPTQNSVDVTGSPVYRLEVHTRDVVGSGTFPPIRTELLTANQFLILAALVARLRG
jgi:hypothetical protein